MRDTVHNLSTADITSDVFVIAPSQIDYIAKLFGDSVADAMNLRPFSNKLRTIAETSLRNALSSARHQGEH